jgi:putative hydroxymethylpyrimidine transport system substrate-binding protein
MRRVVALLAAVALGALAGCGGGGAEPGASKEATLVLDFQPNAVHSGIYAALAEGYYEDAGVDLTVREPSSSTDAPKLLEAGRAQFAILDIHDLAIARERGFDIVGVAPIVNRPLASVIANDPETIRRPRDLEGRTVGVTGLPSDDAVLDSVVSADGGDPSQVKRVTIGFQAVSSLAAGKVDAATAFWNAEGVALDERGIPTRVFRVDDFGAPRYPELVLTTSGKEFREDPGLVREVVDATRNGYLFASTHPDAALHDLITKTNGLEIGNQRDQLRALLTARAFNAAPLHPAAEFDPGTMLQWARWEGDSGIVKRRPDILELFPQLCKLNERACRASS